VHLFKPIIIKRNGIWVKLGDSIREPYIRIAEQGDANEPEAKKIMKTWKNVTTIKRDYVVHAILKERGLRREEDFTGKGREWFCIPVKTQKEAVKYMDDLFNEIGGEGSSLKDVTLRTLQESKLYEALQIIAEHKSNDIVNIVANLCPRFGKTIWALSLFNEISKIYGNRIMMLPAYWLSVHKSFKDEINKYRDFIDIIIIDAGDENAESDINNALKSGRRVVIELSLHGKIDGWIKKYGHLKVLNNDDIYVFSDEADFGSHNDKQINKLQHIFS